MKAQLEAIEKKAFEELTAAQDLKDLDAEIGRAHV